jgi:hypothetical protein
MSDFLLLCLPFQILKDLYEEKRSRAAHPGLVRLADFIAGRKKEGREK